MLVDVSDNDKALPDCRSGGDVHVVLKCVEGLVCGDAKHGSVFEVLDPHGEWSLDTTLGFPRHNVSLVDVHAIPVGQASELLKISP